MQKKSFSSEVKAELSEVKFNQAEAKAELSAMLLFGENVEDGKVSLKTDRAEIAARIQALIKKSVDEEVPIDILKGRRSFCVTINSGLAEKFGVYFYEDGDIALDEDVYGTDAEKRAFLRGAFIISGTMTDPIKEYSCELLTYNEHMSFLSAELLENFGITANTVKRNNYYVTYLKDINSVSDFLNITGAHKMMMELMVARIEKDLKNRTTRQGNCIAANLDKTIAASAKQCEAIIKIQSSSIWSELDEGTKKLAQLRIEMFDSPLSVIGSKMVPPMTKSSVNRRMKKLIELSEEL